MRPGNAKAEALAYPELWFEELLLDSGRPR
jgi:hypothetical protein